MLKVLLLSLYMISRIKLKYYNTYKWHDREDTVCGQDDPITVSADK